MRFAALVKDRERFVEYCRANRVAVGKGYQHLYCPEEYATAHEISKEIVYLPFGNGYSFKEVNRIISVVNSFK